MPDEYLYDDPPAYDCSCFTATCVETAASYINYAPDLTINSDRGDEIIAALIRLGFL